MPEIVFTSHALLRLAQRSLSKEDVFEVIYRPSFTRKSILGRTIASKKLGAEYREVVYVNEKDKIVVITVY